MLGKTNGGGGGFDPSEIQSGTIAVDNVLGLDTLGSIVKGNLAGQYVRVIPAPASTTLTDDEYNAIKGGAFVNGNFLGLHNPVFFPCGSYVGYDYGIVISLGSTTEGSEGEYTVFKSYQIEGKTISLRYTAFSIKNQNSETLFPSRVKINELKELNAKTFPAYPTTNTTPKVLQIAPNGGSLSWGDVPSPAVVAYEGTSLLPTDVVFEDWTLHRAIKDGNVLWIVVAGEITNNSNETKTITNIVDITLPSDISEKIYRQDGTTINNLRVSNSNILEFPCAFIQGSKICQLTSTVVNVIRVKLTVSQSLNAVSSGYISIRIPIFLNTGTVS